MARDRTPRDSILAGIAARCRWIIASASLRVDPPRDDAPAPATPESVADVATKLDALDAKVDSVVSAERARLAATARPAESAAHHDEAWTAAATSIAEAIDDLRRAAPSSRPHRRSVVVARVDVAMRTIEDSLASSRERRASLAAAVAEARRRAEEAVVARDDDAARRELAAGRRAKEHLAAVERESDVRQRLLGEWLRLAELLRAE